MALLKFNKGLYANLPTTYTEGHVYITTDEQAMYVDISASERIRIQQIVSYASYAEFETAIAAKMPPYGADFYYIADANALLKWVSADGITALPDGNDGSVKGTWKQINSTAAVETALATLANEVHGADGKGGLVGSLAALTKRVGDLEAVESQANVVEGATANGVAVAIDEDKNLVLGALAVKNTIATADIDDGAVVEAKIASGAVTSDKIGAGAVSEAKIAAGAVSEEKLAEALKTKINTASTTASNNSTAISNLAKEVHGEDGNGGLAAEVAALKAVDNATQAELDAYKLVVDKQVEDAQAAALADAKAIIGDGYDKDNTVAKAISDLQTSVGSEGLAGRVSDLETTVNTATTGLKDRVSALESHKDDYKTADATLKSELQAEIDADVKALAEGAVAKNTSDISGLTTRVGNLETADTTLQGNIDKVSGRVTTLEGTVGDSTKGLVKEVADIQAAIGENGLAKEIDDLAALVGDGIEGKTLTEAVNENAKAIGDLDTELSDLASQIGNLSNVMNFRGAFAAAPDEDGVETFANVNLDPAAEDGDVIIVGAKEYVRSKGAWIEFGDASGNAAAISALDSRVGEAEGDIDDLEAIVGAGIADTTLTAAVNANTTAIGNINTKFADYYTKTEVDALLAWGSF
mgnify:CR=1 FL=1